MNEHLTVVIVDDNRTNLALMDMLVRKLPNCTTRLYTDPVALIDELTPATRIGGWSGRAAMLLTLLGLVAALARRRPQPEAAEAPEAPEAEPELMEAR